MLRALASGSSWLLVLTVKQWHFRPLKTRVEKVNFCPFLPSVHVVVIALSLRTKSMIPSALVVGKTEITSLSCRTILSSHREWQRAAAGLSHSFVLSAGDPSSPRSPAGWQVFTLHQRLCSLLKNAVYDVPRWVSCHYRLDPSASCV